MNSCSLPEIERLIAAFYAAFDNRGSRPPAIAELRAMFTAQATITRLTPDRIETWTTDAFIAPRAAMLSNGTLTEFHEWEVDGQTTAFDSIASHCSHYRKAGMLNGAPYGGEGRKFIQLCRIDDRWLISSILWQDV